MDRRPERDLGRPGEFPFTRGIYPNMYTGRLWTMRQYAGFGTAEETNLRFRRLLAAGQMGLSTAFDLPTQMGYDSDHPMAQGEVGRVGVAIDTVDDLADLFREIPLDRVSTSMTINATAAILLAMYVVVGEEQGVPRAKLTGTVQNDVLKEYIARGTYIYPAGPSLRLVADIFRFVSDEGMSFNPISISGYHMREAGATAVQEVAFTLANALEYVRVAVDAGLAVDAFGPRLSFFFASHNDLFEEAAKFRAARRLWARLVRERFDAGDGTARLRFHTQTGGVTLQAQQPLTNVVRVTVQALAAVFGGTQSLHTNGYDEALALPTEQSATLALRTQQVIGYESGVRPGDRPAGGELLRREPDRRHRGGGAGADRRGGRPRRRGARHRARLLSGGDRPERVRDPEGPGVGRGGRGGRQPLRRRLAAAGDRDPGLLRPRGPSAGAAGGGTAAPGRRRGPRHPGRASRRGRRRVSPHAPDSRRRPGPRDARRDQRYAAGSLGSVPAGVGRCSPAEPRYEQFARSDILP